MDCSLPGGFVHGIFQERILDWVAISSSGDFPDPEIEPEISMYYHVNTKVIRRICFSKYETNPNVYSVTT